MPDTPKCLECLTSGKVGQTYRVFGTSQRMYKCTDCKKSYPADKFTPLDFAWKDDEESWRQYQRSKGIEIGAKILNNP